MMQPTPLDAWIAEQTHGGGPLDPEKLREYQLHTLNETLAWAMENSPYHRGRLGRLPKSGLSDLGELADLPIMDESILRTRPEYVLCISQGDVARVVTLRTTGSTGEPKRLYFTAEDIAHTVDFFAVGMTQQIRSGDTAMVFMPGATPHSVGDLLRESLTRLQAECVSYGFMDDPARVTEKILLHEARVLIGLPGQLLTLAREQAEALRGSVSSVLLSGEHAPQWLARDIASRLDCEVFIHYGLTETGLGGGVECGAHHGMHLREADLLVEIVDPGSKRPLPTGEPGEIVLTTLRRRGMPLIRYATGDKGMLLDRNCPCGSRVARLLPLGERRGDTVPVQDSHFSLNHVDEAVFRVDRISACNAELRYGASPSEAATLRLSLATKSAGNEATHQLAAEVREAMAASPVLGPLIHSHALDVDIAWTTGAECLAAGPKRSLVIQNNQESL